MELLLQHGANPNLGDDMYYVLRRAIDVNRLDIGLDQAMLFRSYGARDRFQQ